MHESVTRGQFPCLTIKPLFLLWNICWKVRTHWGVVDMRKWTMCSPALKCAYQRCDFTIKFIERKTWGRCWRTKQVPLLIIARQTLSSLIEFTTLKKLNCEIQRDAINTESRKIASCCLLMWVWPLRLLGLPLVSFCDVPRSGKCDAGWERDLWRIVCVVL